MDVGPFVDEITISKYVSPPDTTPPTVTWISPVGDEQVYSVACGATVVLNVSATDDSSGVNRVEFWRWDAVNNVWVAIGVDNSPPYQVNLDVCTLNMSWNQVNAYAYDNAGNWATKYIWIDRVAPPVANFDASPLSGTAPLNVSIHNTSTGNITSCTWQYGDGATGNSCDAYHNHTYTAAGSYTVRLTISGPGGSNTKTRSNYINVSAPPTADLALEQPIEVTNKLSPYAPNDLTLETIVRNRSGAVNIPNVAVTFYDGNPDSGGQNIGSFFVGNLGPGVSRLASINWSLNGNIENHQVYARASTTATITDPDPGNNTKSRLISVYYVNFWHNNDAYHFDNNKAELKFSSSDLKDIVHNLIQETDLNEILSGPYAALYIPLGRVAELGGYCYGMASSSILYFTDPHLKPVPEDTFNMTINQALGNIKRYQRWQLVDNVHQRLFSSYDPDAAYNATRDSIVNGIPILHSLYESGKGGGHVVVAYKLVELDNEKKIFYYDPNNSLNTLDTLQHQETYGTFRGNSFSYSSKFLQNPNYEMNEVYPIHPTVSTDNLARKILSMIRKFFEDLFQNNRAIVVTEILPATNQVSSKTSGVSSSVIIIDPQGRRIGIDNGNIINEIPDATIETFDSLQFFFLPRDLIYTVETSSTTNSTFFLHTDFPIDHDTIRSLEYSNVVVPSGVTARVLLGLLNTDVTMIVGDQEVDPNIDIVTDIGPYTIYLPLILR